MKLIKDLREFIELLNSENVRYLLIGGWALNRYVEPRFTGDIDFFVASDSDNQSRLRVVLVKFGFGDLVPPVGQPVFRKKMIMLGRPPHRIDLLSEISGVNFEEAWDSKEKDLLDGLEVNFISKSHLIANKKASSREKDILDVKLLEK